MPDAPMITLLIDFEYTFGDVTTEFKSDFVDDFGGAPPAGVVEFDPAARGAGIGRHIFCRLFIGEHVPDRGRGVMARRSIINYIADRE